MNAPQDKMILGASVTFLAIACMLTCPCRENGKYYLGISTILPQADIVPHSKKRKKLQREFFLGNGVKESDPIEASKKLLSRDHKDVAALNNNYFKGKLGAKFLPPMYFSEIPKIIDPKEYEAKTLGQGEHLDNLRAENAEKTMFDALKDYFEKAKDDVLILSSHKFLDDSSNNEKDFIIVNLSKGKFFIMSTEFDKNISD